MLGFFKKSFLTVLSVTAASAPLFAQGMFDTRKSFSPFQFELPSSMINVNSAVNKKLNSSLQLNSSDYWNQINQALILSLQENGLGSYINVRVKNTMPLLSLSGNITRSKSFRFFANGMPLCGFEIKAHELVNGTPVILGSYPAIDGQNAPHLQDSPSVAEIESMVAQELETKFQETGTPKFKVLEACSAIENNELVAALLLDVRFERSRYRVLTGRFEVLASERAYFDATGLARIYGKNPTDVNLSDFTLTDLVGDGTLNNNFFSTTTNGQAKASSATHQFIFGTSDKRFDETSAFTHATEMYKWFQSLGFSPSSSTPKIVIDLHTTDESLINNAQYVPGDSSTSPLIQIGSGDGYTLTNLPKDSDVVSHELGHHVIYQTLTSTSGESIVLHEGLADFFAFSKTGDACLGESICPSTSNACVVPSKCLRTAENSIKYGASDFPKYDHEKGQLISGMLWDLRKTSQVPASDLSPLVLKALGYLLNSSGYYDFVTSLMLSDKNNFGGKYCSFIIAAAKNRGLGDIIANLDCNSDLNSLIGTQKQSTSSSTSSGSSSKSKSDSGGGCGVITAGAPSTSHWLNFMINFALIMLPILIVLTRKKSPIA